MDTYELALKRLKADDRTLNELEKAIGLPAETIRDIKVGIVKFPRLNTLRKIASHYSKTAVRAA